MHFFNESLTTFVIVFATLFPVVNPPGIAPIFLNLTEACSPAIRNALARKASINSFLMLFGAMVIGPRVLIFFGISVPVLKIAGGLVVAAMGWKLLNQKSNSVEDYGGITRMTDETSAGSSFYPLTLPLTVGPGAIATMIALVAGMNFTTDTVTETQVATVVGALMGIFAISLSVFIAFRGAPNARRILGVNGTNVMMRLFAFILFTIGVQIVADGIYGLIAYVYQTLPAVKL